MAEERLRFLADASIRLASSQDIGDTLRRLAQSVVPRFADWCTITLRQDDGTVRRIVGVHADPARAQTMEAYLRSCEPEPHRPTAMVETLREGRSYFVQRMDDATLAALAQGGDHLRLIRELGCTSVVVVPLLARGVSIGALALVTGVARGIVTLERAPVDVLEVIDKAIEQAEPLIEQRKQRLVVTVPEGLVVDVDSTRLAQVITNLLTNAAKCTPVGGEIDVVAERAGDRIVLRVRDTGVGIEPAMLPHVFDMFMQRGQALDRAPGGLGLGLTIVKSLVEAHGGTVLARSEGAGRGTEIEIELPALRVRASMPRLVTDSGPTDRPGARVLVVDDNEDAAMLLADVLARRGYITETAADAREAMRQMVAFLPQAAILDIGLPVVDGYELARQIRALPNGQGIYLVALTGYGQAMDRERALAAGFDHHLVKPVDVATLRELLDAALAGSSGIPAPG